MLFVVRLKIMRAHNCIDMAGWKMWEHGVPESRLIVSEYAGTINGKSMWRCICSCEDKNEIVAAGSNIRNGNTLSCGCVHREKTKKIIDQKKILSSIIPGSEIFFKMNEQSETRVLTKCGKIWTDGFYRYRTSILLNRFSLT